MLRKWRLHCLHFKIMMKWKYSWYLNHICSNKTPDCNYHNGMYLNPVFFIHSFFAARKKLSTLKGMINSMLEKTEQNGNNNRARYFICISWTDRVDEETHINKIASRDRLWSISFISGRSNTEYYVFIWKRFIVFKLGFLL